jgi:hypothetical protein
LTLHGHYALNYANSDVAGSAGFPSDQHNLALDYGRASFAIRDRVFFGGSIALPRGFRLSPFMVFSSGSPYNVTVGQDLADDLLFNVRPALASASSGPCPFPTVAACRYTLPANPSSQIPINSLTGPSQFTLNLRLAKSFGFGPETSGRNGAQHGDGPPGGGPGGGGGGHGGGPGGGGGGGGVGFGRGPGGFGGPSSNHRYNLTFSVNARNVLNKVNAAPPIGVLTSPDFGRSIALAGGPFSSAAANRKIELQAMFSF